MLPLPFTEDFEKDFASRDPGRKKAGIEYFSFAHLAVVLKSAQYAWII